MLDITFERTQRERTDVNTTIRSMSYNVPGHEARMDAHCEQVAKEVRKANIVVKIIDIMFKRAIQILKAIPKISNKTEIREELRHLRRKTLKDIKEVWI